MEKYCELVEYLKTEYLRYTSGNQFDIKSQAEASVCNEFDIIQSNIYEENGLRIKLYDIESKADDKSWSFIVCPASFLYATNKEKYRVDLLEKKPIKGIFTIKNKFFGTYAIPAAVIVLGDASGDVWLTTATSSEDVITLMRDVREYGRRVYYTAKLDLSNLMPEHYNVEFDKVNTQLSECENTVLSEIAEVKLGKSAKPYQLGGEGVPYLRVRNLKDGRILDVEDFVIDEAVGEFAKQLLEEGDILLEKYSGVYKLAKVTSEDLPAIASSGLYIIRAFGVPEDYLYNYLTSEAGKTIFQKQLKSIERGAAIKSIRLKDLRELRVPLFDKQIMDGISNIESISARELIPALKQINKKEKEEIIIGKMNYAEATALERHVFNELIQTGWRSMELNRETCYIDLTSGEGSKGSMRWMPDIAAYHEGELLAVFEIKSNFSLLMNHSWLYKMMAILKSGKVPFLIITDGSYYEIHSASKGCVKKQLKPPTKQILLELLEGKGEA